MPTVRRESESEAAAMLHPVKASAAHRLLRSIGRWAAILLTAIVLLAGAGFLWFVGRVPEAEVPLRGGADGIVALAGGASRVVDAIELLAAGRGKRLLISGANRATNSKEISRLNPEFAPWVRCCVDFDWSVNTLGSGDSLMGHRRDDRLRLNDPATNGVPHDIGKRVSSDLSHQI